MSERSIQLLVAAFNAENGADEALQALKTAKKGDLLGIQAAAVVRRDSKDKLHIKEVGELTPGKGTFGGAALGAALGLLTGGTGLVLGAAGALAGRVVGKKHDVGFANYRLEQIGTALQTGTSAIVAIIERQSTPELADQLAALDADVLTASLTADITQQLQARRDVIYSALAQEDARQGVREGIIELGRVVAGAEGLVAEETTLGAEEDGPTTKLSRKEAVAALHIVATEEGILVEAEPSPGPPGDLSTDAEVDDERD